MLLYPSREATEQNIRVWRSLVSRLNGVQEAAGSNPVTRTKREVIERLPLFFCLLTQEPAASCRGAAAIQSAARWERLRSSFSHWFESSHSDQERGNRKVTSLFLSFDARTSGLLPRRSRDSIPRFERYSPAPSPCSPMIPWRTTLFCIEIRTGI